LPYAGSPSHLLPILSETASNGYAYINSDQAGQGSTQNSYIQYTGTIDIEGNEAVFIRFHEYLTRFREQTWVEFSTDMGVTWDGVRTDGFNAGNTSVGQRNAIKEANISSLVGGAGEVMLRFRYVGDWDWYWFIDDVEIFVFEDPDLAIADAVYADLYSLDFPFNDIAPVTKDGNDIIEYGVYYTPGGDDITNIGSINPRVRIVNLGGQELTNIILTVQVLFNGVEIDVLESEVLDLLAIDSFDFIRLEDDYILPVTAGVVVLNYTVSCDQEDVDLTNNVASRTIEISDYFMHGALTNQTNGTLRKTNFGGEGQEPGYVGFGSTHYMYNDATTYGAGVWISNLSVEGTTFSLEIWDYQIDTEDPAILLDGTDLFTYEAATMANQWVDLAFFDPIELLEGQVYSAVVATDQNLVIGNAKNITPRGSAIRFTLNAAWSRITNALPKTRLVLDNTVSINNIEKELIKINAFPSPFVDNLEIQYTLVNEANVQFELFDITGKILLQTNEGRVSSGVNNSIRISGNNLNSGIYFYTLTVNGKRITNKIVKQ